MDSLTFIRHFLAPLETAKEVSEMPFGKMLRHFTQFHSYHELPLTLCEVNYLLSEIKLSGPQRQTHMDYYFLK